LLIHWRPGDETPIHGHAEGGCVFKVLKGRVTESRYTSDARKKFLSKGTYNKGTIAYIDDRMAHHSVGNPFTESAVSIHAYTPGGVPINH
jgi:cysteine dioxygenase